MVGRDEGRLKERPKASGKSESGAVAKALRQMAEERRRGTRAGTA